MEIPLVFIIGTIVTIFGIVWNLKGRSNQGSQLGRDWKAYKEAEQENKISEIIRTGTDLCFNVHLTKVQFEQISSYVEKNIKAFPELENLRIELMNKQMRWRTKSRHW